MPKLLKITDSSMRDYRVLESRVLGIPCQIAWKVVPGYRGYRDSYGYQLEPDEPAQLEYLLFDRHGYAADWLHEKLEVTHYDHESLIHDIINDQYDPY